MTYGIEVILGFTYNDFPVIEKMLETKVEVDDDFVEQLEKSAFAELCVEAHKKAFDRVKFAVQSEEKNGFIIAHTPMGIRKFSLFNIELCFDPEIDITEKDAVIGIPLSGRYYPVFLDWKNQNGTLSPVIFNDETNSLIQIAKEEIVKLMPVFEQSYIIVKERWY